MVRSLREIFLWPVAFAIGIAVIASGCAHKRPPVPARPMQVFAPTRLPPTPIGQLAPESESVATMEEAPCCDPVTGTCTILEPSPAKSLPPPRHIPGGMPRYSGPPPKKCVSSQMKPPAADSVFISGKWWKVVGVEPIPATFTVTTTPVPQPLCRVRRQERVELPQAMIRMLLRRQFPDEPNLPDKGTLEHTPDGTIWLTVTWMENVR